MARKTSKQTTNAQQMTLQSHTALYIRVSTDKQADEGFSLDEQRTRLEAHCVAQGWDVSEEHIYIDAGVSGKTASRPEFQRMLAAAKAGDVCRIVAVKLDRMARNTKNFLELVDKLDKWNCDMVLIKENFDTGTPNGKFALTMFAAIAELEASQITERVMSGKKQKASLGGYNGSFCPLGYTYDADTESFSIDDGNAETIRYIFDEYIATHNLNAVARELNAKGATTAKGGKWYPATVKYILSNGMYAGIAQYDETEKENVYPAIVESHIYETAFGYLMSAKRGAKEKFKSY